MKSRSFRVLISALALLAVAACDSQATSDPTSPTSAATPSKTPDVSEHESGPESPIAYGLYVPRGATQLGPLFRYRSARLISAYRPELEAELAQKEAEAADKIAEDEANGTPAPPPTPTPTTRPSKDSFKLLEDPPRPDTSISLMRIDGDPTEVVRRMLAQIDAALPDANLVLDDLSTYCRAKERRITSCHVTARGETDGRREIRITMDVDPGKLATRTAPPAALTHPVMQVSVQFVGDPRAGQLTRDTGTLHDVADIKAEDEKSDLIWPKMDEDAPSNTKLVNGWTAPDAATLLLTGFRPKFVELITERAEDADQIAEQFVKANSPKGKVTKDVVEDLNAVSTMYTVRTRDGGIARAVYSLSARGNYTALFYTPATK